MNQDITDTASIFRAGIFSAILSGCGFLVRSFKKIANSRAKIIVFRPDELGDFILWLDAAKKLRECFHKKQYKIVLFCKPANRPLAEQFDYWDKIVDFKPGKYTTCFFYRVWANFKLIDADIVINPLPGRPFMIDRLTGHSPAKKKYGLKIGWDQIGRTTEATRNCGDQCYTRLVETPLTNHIVQINIAFVNQICGTNYSAALQHIDVSSPNAIDENPGNYYIIIPGAGSSGRCWESFKFAELINQIQELHPDTKVMICGTGAEQVICRKISALVKDRSQIIDQCGKTSLIELMKLIGNSKLVIGNETGAMHWAPILQVPSVSILGGGHFGLFQPYPEELTDGTATEYVYHRMPCYGCTWSCYKATTWDQPHPCIAAITVEEVFEKVRAIMRRPRNCAQHAGDGSQ